MKAIAKIIMANLIVFLLSFTVVLMNVENNVLTDHPVVHSRMTFLRILATFFEVGRGIPKMITCGLEI